ncbi:MAG: hypothetical protein IJ786_03180 [Bacteroidaceae bacterium]|nr:hypothetical protein [Bacteroidaceae bacterium]
MKRTYLSSILLFVCSLWIPATLAAQDSEARAVLDQVANQLKNAGGIQAQFTITSYNGREEAGSSSGTLSVKGRKFKLVSPQIQQWFDGTTLWALEAGATEIYVSKPTRAELQQINPYSFVDMYKQGYVLNVDEDIYEGHPIKDIHLVSKSTKNPIQELYVSVGQDNMPFSVRVRMGKKNWLKIRINSLKTGIRFPDTDFVLNTARFPNYEIIDLR